MSLTCYDSRHYYKLPIGAEGEKTDVKSTAGVLQLKSATAL